MQKVSLILAAAFVAVAAQHQPDYQFPEGFPLWAHTVTWYESQKHDAEFPFRTGALDGASGFKTFKFERTRGTERIVGEVIQIGGRTTEIAVMRFDGAKRPPEFQLWRSFGAREEIAPYLTGEAVRLGRFQDSRAPEELRRTRLVHEVELSREGILAILAKPFRNVLDQPFSEQDGFVCYAPTTKQEGSIVPAGSDRGALNAAACLACHQQAGKGNVRGRDFVFSR